MARIACLALLAAPASSLRLSQESDYENYQGPKIVCTGWKKTGTTSMGMFYKKFGLAPWHGVNSCKGPSCLKGKAKATEDAYTCCNHHLVQAMKKMYPADHVKFVHTERRPERWNKSVAAWIRRPDKGKHFAKMYGHLMQAKFGSKEFNENYERHNQFIRDLFKDQPDRLLILNLEDDDPIENTQKLCAFVGISNVTNRRCNQAFPHSNANRKKKHFSKGQATLDLGDLDSSDPWLNVDEYENELETFDLEAATQQSWDEDDESRADEGLSS